MAAPRQSGFGFFSLSKKRLESFFIGRRPVLNALAEILLLPLRPFVTRMKRECDLAGCREILSDVNYGPQARSKCCKIEDITLTRYYQKFVVNFDFGFLCRAFFSFAKKNQLSHIYSYARLMVIVVTLTRNYD